MIKLQWRQTTIIISLILHSCYLYLVEDPDLYILKHKSLTQNDARIFILSMFMTWLILGSHGNPF